MAHIPVNIYRRGGPFDIVIVNGSSQMGFRTDGSPAKRQVSQQAQRVRVGGAPEYSTEAFDMIVIRGFDGGGDREVLESGDRRYYVSDGGVALHVPGHVTLESQWSSAETSQTATYRRFVDFNVGNGYVLMAAGTSLRAYNATTQTWGSQGTFASNAVYLFANDQYVWVACGTGADFWRWDGTTWTQPAAGVKRSCFGWFRGTLYGTLAHQFFTSTDNGATWGAATAVGWTGTNIEDVIVGQGGIFFAKKEGLYVYDGTTVNLVLSAENNYATGNFVGGAEFQGALYVPWAESLWKVSGITKSTGAVSSVSNITPRMIGDANKELYGHGVPKVCFAGPNFMHIAFHQQEGSYPALLAYSGVGFFQQYLGTSAVTFNAAGYSRLTGKLYLNAGTTTYAKNVTNTGFGRPYADYPTTGYQYFRTPWMDAGFPDEDKSFRSVAFEAKNCSATQTITVAYRTDLEDWTVLDPVVSDANKHELALGGAAGQVTGRKLQLEFRFATASASQTPDIVGDILTRVIVTPKAVDVLVANLILMEAQALRNSWGLAGNKYTIQQMEEFLSDARNTPNTLQVIDERGRLFLVKITDLGDEPRRISVSENDDRDKIMAPAKMLNMFPGLERSHEINLTESTTASLAAASNINTFGGARFGGGVMGS